MLLCSFIDLGIMSGDLFVFDGVLFMLLLVKSFMKLFLWFFFVDSVEARFWLVKVRLVLMRVDKLVLLLKFIELCLGVEFLLFEFGLKL